MIPDKVKHYVAMYNMLDTELTWGAFRQNHIRLSKPMQIDSDYELDRPLVQHHRSKICHIPREWRQTAVRHHDEFHVRTTFRYEVFNLYCDCGMDVSHWASGLHNIVENNAGQRICKHCVRGLAEARANRRD